MRHRRHDRINTDAVSDPRSALPSRSGSVRLATSASRAATPPRSAHDDEPVQRAQKYLLAHFKEEVDLDQVANKVGMSPRNFARRFKAATGEAPLAYLHRLRIDTARKFLENAHLSVQEICQKIGYEDVAFFRKLFRRHTGSSPRQYRERFGPRRAN